MSEAGLPAATDELELLRSRVIGIIGYGAQGRAQGLNLHDSGCRVLVGLQPHSSHRSSAAEDGFEVLSVTDAAAGSDIVALLIPDHLHASVFESALRDALGAGKMLLVAHGFSIHFGQLVLPADIDVGLVAPVGPGAMLRRLYSEGFGVPAVIAVQQNGSGQAESLVRGYAEALGCGRVAILPSTFEEETETDLFGEQAVLCGGLTALVRAGFDTLVEAGYSPDLAYIECLNQVKLIADLLSDYGIAGLNERISDTAEYGEYVSGPRVIGDESRRGMKAILQDIRDGTFAHEWAAETEAGMPLVRSRRAAERTDLIEEVGARLRAKMSQPVEEG